MEYSKQSMSPMVSPHPHSSVQKEGLPSVLPHFLKFYFPFFLPCISSQLSKNWHGSKRGNDTAGFTIDSRDCNSSSISKVSRQQKPSFGRKLLHAANLIFRFFPPFSKLPIHKIRSHMEIRNELLRTEKYTGLSVTMNGLTAMVELHLAWS